MEFPITLENARGLLARAVLTQGPDFTYAVDPTQECRYDPIDNPTDPSDPRCKTGCLVGVALDLAGETRHHGFKGSVGSLRSDYPDMLTVEAGFYLGEAQRAQDEGVTWGQAYTIAEVSLAVSDA